MTVRACLIGNSHLSVVASSWRALAPAATAGVQATFFGAVGNRFDSLVERQGVLESDREDVRTMMRITSGGQCAIRVADYDVFVLVGLGVGFLAAASLYRRGSRWQDGLATPHLYSDACQRQALEDALAGSVALRLRERLARCTARPVLLLQEPYPSAAARGLPAFAHLARLHEAGGLPALQARYAATLDRLCRERALRLVPQHPATLESPGFTRAEFTRGAEKGDVKLLKDASTHHTEDNYRHMNADYGRLLVADLLAAIGGAVAVPALP